MNLTRKELDRAVHNKDIYVMVEHTGVSVNVSYNAMIDVWFSAGLSGKTVYVDQETECEVLLRVKE